MPPTDAPAPGAPAPVQAARGSVRMVVASIGLLLLLASLDQTIVSTALPTIVADLGGIDHLSWLITAYILASTIVAPLYGKLGDLYGRRQMVFVSVGLFLFGSTLCGLAGSMETLIAARAVQGLGGGGLFVLALAVVGDVIAPRDRGKVQGVFAAAFSVSSVIGPLMGGAFVEVASWHWIFFINLPLGALAVAGFAASFPAMENRVRRKIDWTGAALLSVALGALTLVTSLGGHAIGWTSAPALGLAAVVLVAGTAFALVERRAAEPILPPALFASAVFRTTSAIGFVAGAALFGAITFLPIYLQIAKGLSPTVSGLMLVPMTLGILASANIAGRYMGRTGRYRILPVIGCVLMCAGGLLLSRIGVATAMPVFGASVAVLGLGLGCIFPVVTTAVQNAVPREMLGTATAAGVMFRQIGGSLGVAAFGALFAARIAEGMGGAGLAGSVELGPGMLARLAPEARDQMAGLISGAIQPIYLIVAGLAVVAFLIALRLQEVPLANRFVPKDE